MSYISIFGAGTWGAALAILLCGNGHNVTIMPSRPESFEKLSVGRRIKNLDGVMLPEKIRVARDAKEAASLMDMCVLAVGSPYIRQMAARIAPFVKDGTIVVNAAKGIEEGSLKLIDEQLEEEIPNAKIAVLSGPSHAEEVCRGMPTTCVVGSRSKKTAEAVQGVFINPFFRVYTSPDVMGIELGGALKNVIALAAGVADGLGYGDNTKAALITRGITEIARLGVAMGADIHTLYGLSGIGDLIVTCASKHSRNRRAGFLMGRGHSMEESMRMVNMVVEGVYSARAAKALAQKYDVSMPIVEETNRLLFDGRPPREAVDALMLRDRKIEHAGASWSGENI